MFTETELREALQHSAARADSPIATALSPTPSSPRSATPTRPPWLLPLAAAATVAALAAGVVALAGDDRANPGPGQPAASAASSSIVSSGAASTTAPRPLTDVDLVDLATAGVDADYQFYAAGDRQVGSQTIRHSLGSGRNDGAMTLDLVPAGSVDPARIERGKRVEIAGTTGWFSALKVYPLDGSTGPGSDKWLPHWTIAFRTPSNDWAFASIELAINGDDSNLDASDVSVKDAAAIEAGLRNLKITWSADAARQALRLGELPAGLPLVSAFYATDGGKITNEDLSFARGDTRLDVQFSTGDSPVAPTCVVASSPGQAAPPPAPPSAKAGSSTCEQPVGRAVAGGRVTVDGGLERAEQERVLAAVTVLTDPNDYVGFAEALTP